MTKSLFHYHVIVEYDGTTQVSDFGSFTAGVEKAREEIAVERLLDRGQPRNTRRKYTRREFIPGVYAEWVGSSSNQHSEPPIRIEVSACTEGLHA